MCFHAHQILTTKELSTTTLYIRLLYRYYDFFMKYKNNTEKIK